MANIDKAKRQKKPNFSDRELSIMLESISENYDAIASKQQNALTNKQKKQAWNFVADKVNAHGGYNRDASAVKKKWKDMKSQFLSGPKGDAITGGGRPSEDVPFKSVIAQILGDGSNLSEGVHGTGKFRSR